MGQKGLISWVLIEVLLFFITHYSLANSLDPRIVKCQKRVYFHDSFVCVCNATACDQVEELNINKSDIDEAVIYSTSLPKDRLKRSVKRFERKNGSKENERNNSIINIQVNPKQKFQQIIGFGGAITDASMKVLSHYYDPSRGDFLSFGELLFHQYYGPRSISYTLGRVPIASCDFSTTNYSYLDKAGDFELETFSLSNYEFHKRIFLARIQGESNPPLRLFASPWSAPWWLKTNGQMQGGGAIREGVLSKYGLVYAKYFIRFFEEYAKNGVRFWATTIQNEPSMAGVVSWQSMQFSAKDQKEFVQQRLAPLFKQNWVTKDLKIMVHDDFRGNLFDSAKEYYAGDDSQIDGLAFHWYGGGNYDKINQSYQLKPDKFLLSTEACNAYDFEHAPQLGLWEYAQRYAHDIIQTLLNGGAGWVDWNTWLDEQGGPNWQGNFVDAPIIVNVTSNEFYKQPMYYIMGQFSKFVLPDSFRIDLEVDKPDDQLEVIGFETPKNQIVVVLLNRSPDRTFNLSISIENQHNKQLEIELESKSIKTVIWII